MKAVRAAVPDAVELDELDEVTLAAIRRSFDRAEALDADLDRERGSDQPSANRISMLSAEARLAEAQGEKWSREVVKAATAIVESGQKSWQHQKAAKARWSGQAANTAGR